MNLRLAAWLAVLLWQAVEPNEPPRAQPEHLKYERSISLPGGAGQACAVLDPQIFPHAAPSLKDLRLFPAPPSAAAGPNAAPPRGPREVPYALTLSDAMTEETQPARVLNLGSSGSKIVFDLEMPERPYSEVTLDLAGQDFLATATVSGMNTPGGNPTALGAFTLFDLSTQHLSRDTTLPLEESTFRYLHVALSASAAPASRGQASAFVASPSIVRGAEVPPSRESQIVYTTVAAVSAETTGAQAPPRKTRFDLALPLRVPVERISFDLPPGFAGNFSRDVTVRATPAPQTPPSSGASLPIETVAGTISRVHSTQAGHRIDEQQLSVAALLGSNLQTPAHVWVEIDNGDDQPLPIAAVRLEMRQRQLCFEAPPHASPLALYYGDPTIAAPVYDYERLFVPAESPLAATLGPELPNPNYRPPPAELRPFTERHPEVLWIALIAVICVLGTVALRSSRNIGH